MNIQEVIDELFLNTENEGELNVIEVRKDSERSYTLKVEDMNDGSIGIFYLSLQYQGFAKSLKENDFEVEEN